MNDTLKKHFMNPVNMGKIKNPTHCSKCKSGFCGDTIELYAIVDNTGIVTDVRYNVFGCYAVIATASILSEWAIGKPLDIVRQVEYGTLVELIGERPEEEKENCINVAVKAFADLKQV